MLAVLCIMLGICVIHEALHMLTAEYLGITVDVSWRTWRMIPYALAVDMEGYSSPYRCLPPFKRRRYNTVAIAPYLFIVPFTVFLFLTGDMLLMASSVALQATHLINYPLEWLVQ